MSKFEWFFVGLFVVFFGFTVAHTFKELSTVEANVYKIVSRR